MSTLSLFDTSSRLRGIYVFFMVNRLQMLYFVLVMPMYLIQPYMIWAILAVGLVSQLNLFLISGWLKSDISSRGYSGFTEVFGKRGVRLLAGIALLPLLLKITVLLFGYTDIVHQYLFPATNQNWLVLAIFVVCCYLAVQGLHKTLRFAAVVFVGTIGITLLYLPFYLPPTASIRDLYPLIPSHWPSHTWKGFLFVFSVLSSPEYLVILAPWFESRQNMLKSLSLANAFSILEYLLLFVAALLFFGPNYLSRSHYPVINMIRYLQYPFFERIDLFLISLHALPLVFAVAIFVLYFYGAVRIAAGRVNREITFGGYASACTLVGVCVLIINTMCWQKGQEMNIWPMLQMWLGVSNYLLLPVLLIAAAKWKGRAK